MSSSPVTSIRRAWYKWKSLHLPWRKRFLVGLDLQGNTFWEFRDTLSAHKNRMRRIVQYPPTTPYSDLNISPQWHQWLRHTRRDPPSIAEQSQDVLRLDRLKVLARRADERWAAKPSFLDRPGGERGQAVPTLGSMEEGGLARGFGVEEREVGRSREEVLGGEGRGGVRGARLGDGRGEDGTADHQGEQESSERPDGARVKEKTRKDDPWKKARGAPSEDWQPAAWSPSSALKRG